MPPPAKPTGAILWLHDVGESDPNEFARISALTSHLPWLSVHCPGCPAGRPKYEWFDHAVLMPSGEPHGLPEALKAVHERVEHLVSVLSIDASRILLGGFGQGGALAIAAGLSCRWKLAGILSHSGYVCHPVERLESQCKNRSTPIMLVHGEDDETVKPAASRAAEQTLRAAGAEEVILRMFEDTEHKMTPPTLGQLIDFARSRLPVNAPSASHGAAGSLNVGAKSKSVVKMGGRRAGSTQTEAEPPAGMDGGGRGATRSYATGRPSAKEDAFAVLGSAGDGRSQPVATMPSVMELGDALPAAAATKATGKTQPKPSPPPPKPSTAARSAHKSVPPPLSPDPATAAALASKDKVALEKALLHRGNDPLSEGEMGAIASVMLGSEGAEALAGALQREGSGGGEHARAHTQQRGAPPPTVKEATACSQAELDSDDEEDVGDDKGESEEGGASHPSPHPTDISDRPAVAPPPPPEQPQRQSPPQAPVPPMDPLVYTRGTSRYDLLQEDRGVLCVVRLPPTVASMAQLEVEASERKIDVAVDGEPFVCVELGRRIEDGAASAKLLKKTRELRIRAPYATSG
jgi:phospholipase/carboxylesterase